MGERDGIKVLCNRVVIEIALISPATWNAWPIKTWRILKEPSQKRTTKHDKDEKLPFPQSLSLGGAWR